MLEIDGVKIKKGHVQVTEETSNVVAFTKPPEVDEQTEVEATPVAVEGTSSDYKPSQLTKFLRGRLQNSANP